VKCPLPPGVLREQRCDHTPHHPRQIVAEVAKLKMPDIKAIGERIECHLTGRTKAAMVSRLENWLSDIKLSAEQASFTLTGTGTS
jgi:hypothetical protein